MATATKEDCVVLTWEIENYTLLFQHDGCQLISSLWKMDIREGSEWFWLKAESYPKNLSFRLNSMNEGWRPKKWEMSLITSDEEVPLKRKAGNYFSLKENNINKQKILQNETLTVCCRMWKETLRTDKRRIRSIVKKANFLRNVGDFCSQSFVYHTFIQEDVFFHFELEPENKDKYHKVTVWGLTTGEGVLAFVNCAVSFRDGVLLDVSKGGDLWSPTTCKGEFKILSGPEFPGLKIQLEIVYSVSSLHEDTCSSDFLQLYKEQVFADVTLSAEGRSISAHRAILAARSPVFRAMFEQRDTSEALSGLVAIDDVDSDTLDRMLGFLYGDCIGTVSWEEASSLYYAADKYSITPLKQKCARVLKSGLTTDNVCDALVLADRHGEEELMKVAEDFICNHQEVVTTEKWEDMEKNFPSLTCKVFRNFFLKSKRRK